MKNKKARLQVIADILRTNVVGSQEKLLELLKEQDCEVTQATLSRDLRFLKVSKTPLSDGTYKYVLPQQNNGTIFTLHSDSPNTFSNNSIVSVEFSGQLAVVKTKPGYANAIAWDIDNVGGNEVLGTIAGDDTILIIMRDGVTHKDIVSMMNINFSIKENS